MTAKNKKRILIVHPRPDSRKGMIAALEAAGFSVTIAPDTDIGISQIFTDKYDMLLISDRLQAKSTTGIIKLVKENPFAALTPAIILSSREYGYHELVMWVKNGAITVVSESADPEDYTSIFIDILDRRETTGVDVTSGLPSGPMLMKIIGDLCENSTVDWHYISIKLTGIRPFNLRYGYEQGNKLITGFGKFLEEIVQDTGDRTDLAGRLYGPRFCIVTKAKRVETVCRGLITKSERFFRKYYTPFELSRGYITVEDGKQAGEYRLCELYASAVRVQAKWGRTPAELFDISEEGIQKALLSEKGYVISGL